MNISRNFAAIAGNHRYIVEIPSFQLKDKKVKKSRLPSVLRRKQKSMRVPRTPNFRALAVASAAKDNVTASDDPSLIFNRQRLSLALLALPFPLVILLNI